MNRHEWIKTKFTSKTFNEMLAGLFYLSLKKYETRSVSVARSEWVGPHIREMARTMVQGVRRIHLSDELAHVQRIMSGTDPTDPETVVNYIMTRPFNAIRISDCA